MAYPAISSAEMLTGSFNLLHKINCQLIISYAHLTTLKMQLCLRNRVGIIQFSRNFCYHSHITLESAAKFGDKICNLVKMIAASSCQSQFKPKMKANAVLRLLSSLV